MFFALRTYRTPAVVCRRVNISMVQVIVLLKAVDERTQAYALVIHTFAEEPDFFIWPQHLQRRKVFNMRPKRINRRILNDTP